MPGNFFTNHFLKRPSRTTMKSMRNAEKELEIIFPIVPRNRITCSTCHNPHQKGVIVTSAAQKGADAPMRLRMQSPAICISCHPTK
jgi:hypothetical protein